MKTNFSACSSDSLLGYLKALGLFRILNEQAGKDIKCSWKDGVFSIDSELDIEDVLEFFLYRYTPSTIMVPWSSGEFFQKDDDRAWDPGGNYKVTNKNPKTRDESSGSQALVTNFLATDSKRLKRYREGLKDVLADLRDHGIDKATLKEVKDKFLRRLRGKLDETFVRFVDVTRLPLPQQSAINSLLGSGGGNDSRFDYGVNFMMALWEVLPDFHPEEEKIEDKSRNSLLLALDGEFREPLLKSDKSSNFYRPIEAKAPNATPGKLSGKRRNPWDFVLALEGTLLLSGAISRRHGTKSLSRSSFPFMVSSSFGASSTGVPAEDNSQNLANQEFWLPVWSNFISKGELETVFGEGRLSSKQTWSSDTIEARKALSGLSIDRGLDGYERFRITYGRKGKTLLSLHEGYVPVPEYPSGRTKGTDDLDLLRDRLRRAAFPGGQDRAEPRYAGSLHKFEQTLYEAIDRDDTSHYLRLFRTISTLEQESARRGESSDIPPITGLSPRWIDQIYGDRPEIRLGLSLAAIRNRTVGPMRAYLEPIDWTSDSPFVNQFDDNEKNRACWANRSLPANLVEVLSRRLLDYSRSDTPFLPLNSDLRVPPEDVHRFLEGNINPNLVEDTLWAGGTIDWSEYDRSDHLPKNWKDKLRGANPSILPDSYGFLKSLFRLFNRP